MVNLSFWERNTFFNAIDVVIIGSGITGLNAALSLKNKNRKLRILILERGIFPTGASSKNAGFASFGSPSELLADLKNSSQDQTFLLIEKRWKGLLKLRKNLGDAAIDFHNWGGYEVFDSNEKYNECEHMLPYLNKQLAAITGEKTVYRNADKKIRSFGFKNVSRMIENTAESQIDTGKLMTALIKKVRDLGIEVMNGIEVQAINDEDKLVTVKTKNGIDIICKKAIIATNGFARELLPGYPIQPARAQVLITRPIKNLKLKGTFHFDEGYYFFRNIGNRVLFGGGRNLDFKTESTTQFGLTALVQDRLEELLKEMIVPYTSYTIDMRWSGIMGMGPEKKSIVQAVSNNVFCAVRLGGMGIAIGSLIGEEVAAMTAANL